MLGAAILLGLAATPAWGGAERLHVVVLHTNDIHGQVVPRPAVWVEAPNPPLAGGLPRVAAAIEEVRAQGRREGFGVLVVDAGDWFQGTPEGSVDDGRPFLEALAALDYDALCLGNHELDHGVGVLEGHLAAVAPPVVVANVAHAGERPLTGTRPWRRVSVATGETELDVALVGLLTTSTPAITHPSARRLEFEEPARALARVREELEGEVDWILPITHLGLHADRELARAFPDLDLVVGGHSHTFLAEGTREGRTLIVQVGSRASAVGRVDVWFDAKTKRVVEARATALELYDEPPGDEGGEASEVRRRCRELERRTAEAMDVEVGRLAEPLLRSRDRLASSSAGNLITDAMRAWTGAEVALQNRGGIRADLRTGVVTRRDLFDVLPFGNHLVTFTLAGSDLEALLERAVEGRAHSGLELSGAELTYRQGARGPELVAVRVGERPLEASARYRVTVNSYLAHGGDDYVELSRGERREDDPAVLREVLEATFRERGTVRPDGRSRYVRQR